MAIRELLASLVAACSLVASGMSLGFPAISLDQLRVEGLSEDEASWFASVLSVAQIFGCLLCGPLLDAYGRKMALIVTSIPFIVGWVILCAMPQPLQLGLLFFGRVMTGVASGMASIPAAIYIGEIATNRYRGMLVTWPSLGMCVGILLVYLLGWAIQDDWRLVSGITIAPPVLASVLALLCLKETPFWLLTKGREKDANESFRWIRGVSEDQLMATELREEFEEMVQNAKRRAEKQDDNLQISTITNIMKGNPTSSSGNRHSRFQKAWRHVCSLGSPDAWKPLVIHNLYFFIMQFGGIQVVAAYAVDIMKSAGVTMDSYGATVLLGGVQTLGAIGATFSFTRYGRRVVSLVSGSGMAITMIGLGIYLEVADVSSDLSWLPLLLILGYIAFANFGFNLIAWGLLGELYPTAVAGLAGGITTCLANLFGFAAIKLYPGFQDALRGDSATTGGGFFFFGAVALVGTVFVFLFLPETFKKSLEQIGEEFRQPCRKSVLCC